MYLLILIDESNSTVSTTLSTKNYVLRSQCLKVIHMCDFSFLLKKAWIFWSTPLFQVFQRTPSNRDKIG